MRWCITKSRSLGFSYPISQYPDPLMAGGYGAGDPPDPIPNSEVKTRCADGTAGATRWESTAPPACYWTTPALILVVRAGVRRFRWFRGAYRT